MKLWKIGILVALLTLPVMAQVPWDQTFKPDIEAPEHFRANRTSYSAIMDVLRPTRPDVSDEDLAELATYQIENIWGGLGDYQENYVRGFVHTQDGTRIVGRALTMRALPPRPDLRRAVDALAAEGNWDSRGYVRAGEEGRVGDIVVAERGGFDGDIFFGDMTALGMKLRGIKGVIIEGATRDQNELNGEEFEGFPVYARYFDPRGPEWLGVSWNVPVRVGTATVLPGDIVVAEAEAVLFFPPEILPQVLQAARDRQALENYERELMNSKQYRIRDVYPLSPTLREEYERKRRQPPPQ